MFIIVLAVSAFFEADIRWLHFFQAWMYVATIVLSLRRNRWGYFIGIGAAGFWAYAGLFVNTFVASGVRHLMRLDRPDQIIAVPAWLANAAIVIGCVWAYSRVTKRASDLVRFAVAVALTMAFFALDMQLFQPRYLSLFPRLLHPHWPWVTS
ncbi:MAG TPA: hypothetical protein VJ853_13625 [Thermoanaerobaculia bacterium]|nr:hypothetical protein [Thermoanaerobaculia bacterium]